MVHVDQNHRQLPTMGGDVIVRHQIPSVRINSSLKGYPPQVNQLFKPLPSETTDLLKVLLDFWFAIVFISKHRH